jgi:hypothetical protein
VSRHVGTALGLGTSRDQVADVHRESRCADENCEGDCDEQESGTALVEATGTS